MQFTSSVFSLESKRENSDIAADRHQRQDHEPREGQSESESRHLVEERHLLGIHLPGECVKRRPDEQHKVAEQPEIQTGEKGQDQGSHPQDEQHKSLDSVSGIVAVSAEEAEKQGQKNIDKTVFLFHIRFRI